MVTPPTHLKDTDLMPLKYRPEIDGLRTIAVISVIIYHAEFTIGANHLLRGGFIGVDVFFVISGFLITSLIMNEHHRTGRFSITNFYERRARRILPALLTVMLVSLPFAWNYLLPDQLVDFSKSLISSLLFGSNIYWYNTLQTYGAESALLKPFLHTWSLAVEEQYYIIFPLLLVGMFRWCKRLTVVLLTAGLLISLQFAEWMTAREASFSFYMLPSRLWELLAGGLMACILHFHPQKDNNALLNSTMPALGLFLIILSVIFIELDSNHPGFVTLIPVIGTVLIIWFANEKEFVTKLLSSKLFVGVGLISYSLYLWHYPIFAFSRIRNSSPSDYDKFEWILLTFALAIVTYFVIERPVRRRNVVSRKIFMSSIVIFTIVVGGMSFYCVRNDGFENRLGYLKTIIKPSLPIWVTLNEQKCHSGGGGRNPVFDVRESCVFNYNPGQKYIISIGDSHAGCISENLRLLAKNNGLNFIQITSAGCNYILEYGSDHCQKRASEIIPYLEGFPNSTIIYSARIPVFIEQSKFINEEGIKEDNYRPIDKKRVVADYERRSNMLVRTLNGWVDAGHNLVIVYPVPEQGYHVSKKLFMERPIIQGEDQLPDLTTSYSFMKKRTKTSFEALDRIVSDKVFRIYPENLFCDSNIGKCFASKGSQIFFSSDNHVSPLGSSLIVDDIQRVLNLKTPAHDN